MGRVGLGPREVHSRTTSSYALGMSDGNGGNGRKELDLAESEEGRELERGEYTLVGGGGHANSENESGWISRLRPDGHEERVIEPFIVPTLGAGMRSDETIAVSSGLFPVSLLSQEFKLIYVYL